MTDVKADEPGAIDPGAYCREVESYLCRRNGGHLIRLVGPAFLLVARWAEVGVPLRIVQHGIDRTVTRLEARGPRRRPVRIEFCEADVLDAFDQWRRAVGPALRRSGGATPPPADAAPGDDAARGDEGAAAAAGGRSRRGPSLPLHLERVIQRLSSLRAGTSMPAAAATAIDRALERLDALSREARGLRGEARQAVHDELARLDEALLGDVLDALDADGRTRLRHRADEELRPMRDRLDVDVYREASDRLVRQLVRHELGLPELVLR